MDLFYFSPASPHADMNAFEYEGTKIGISNIVTSIRKNFTDSDSNKIDIDEIMLEKMFVHIKHIEENQKMFLCDAILHGVRVRLMTNSKHLSEFFTDNFYNPREYSEQVQSIGIAQQGSIVPFKVNMYAINGIFDNTPLFCYSSNTNTIYVFNCSYYKVIFELILEAVSKILREDRGFMVEHCHTLEKNGAGVSIIGCRNASFGCEERYCSACFRVIPDQGVKLQSAGYSVFRFAFYKKGEEKLLSPIKITFQDKSVKKGAELLEYFMSQISDAPSREKNEGAAVLCLTPKDEKIEVPASEIDFDRQVELFSYPLFKSHYQKTGAVKFHAISTYHFLHSKLENIPEITQEYIIANNEYLETFVRNELKGSRDASIAKYFNSISEEDGKKYVARFGCFSDSHVLIDYSKVFGKMKLINNPLETSPMSVIAVPEIRQSSELSDALFLKSLNIGENFEKTQDSPLLNMMSKCPTLKVCKARIYFYDELKTADEEKAAKKGMIYEACMKKLLSLNKDSHGVNIDGTNYESLFPPPPPPPAPRPPMDAPPPQTPPPPAPAKS